VDEKLVEYSVHIVVVVVDSDQQFEAREIEKLHRQYK
jgi:hypothetical protein